MSAKSISAKGLLGALFVIALTIGLMPATAHATTNVYSDSHYLYVVEGSSIWGLGNVTVKGRAPGWNNQGYNRVEFYLYKDEKLVDSLVISPSVEDVKELFSWTFSTTKTGYGSYRVTFGNKIRYASIDGYYWDYIAGMYEATFTVSAERKANPMTVKAKTVTVKKSKVNKAAQTVKAAKAFEVKNAKGTVTYAVTKTVTKGATKKVKVAKNGKITVKKGTPAGTYKLKVKVSAAGDNSYKPKSKTVTLVVKVK